MKMPSDEDAVISLHSLYRFLVFEPPEMDKNNALAACHRGVNSDDITWCR